MGHANLDDLGEKLDGGTKVKVGGPMIWADDDAEALIYVMVCQAPTHTTSTVAREESPLVLRPPAPRFDIYAKVRSGPPFRDGMTAVSALAIFTNDVGELAAYAWTDCVHLPVDQHSEDPHHPGTVAS